MPRLTPAMPMIFAASAARAVASGVQQPLGGGCCACEISHVQVKSTQKRKGTRIEVSRLGVSIFSPHLAYFLDLVSVPTNTGPPSEPSSCRMKSTESSLHITVNF